MLVSILVRTLSLRDEGLFLPGGLSLQLDSALDYASNVSCLASVGVGFAVSSEFILSEFGLYILRMVG